MAGLHQLHKPNSPTSFYDDDRAHKQINGVFIALTTLKNIYGVGMLINASMFCGSSSGTDSFLKEHERAFPTFFLNNRNPLQLWNSVEKEEALTTLEKILPMYNFSNLYDYITVAIE